MDICLRFFAGGSDEDAFVRAVRSGLMRPLETRECVTLELVRAARSKKGRSKGISGTGNSEEGLSAAGSRETESDFSSSSK